MTRKPLTWYCPTCDRDADPYGVGIVEHYGEMRSAWCGHTLLANGTAHEAWARFGNALSGFGRVLKESALDDWAWIRRKVRR